ncbi:type IV toxin-antitoxin system AbiEi family antitoxin domain-containing protein [Xylanimonas sp. McL0601]|uniref:type IV toxin-antitoxin system AbiEi family antitoxin domain-containing protein n=1 Tax=Xylanimonas sp. McL0601 TaxID=3414739 RepID=UPI003CF52760
MAQTRTLGPALGQVIEELELDQPIVVTTADVAGIAARRGIKTPASEIARRLRLSGWLLPTGQRGVYEFAPGAHAGAASTRPSPTSSTGPTTPFSPSSAGPPTPQPAHASATCYVTSTPPRSTSRA